MLLTCFKNRGSELLPKRAVFDGDQPANAPQEAPVSVERVHELQGKTLDELRTMLSQDNVDVQEKKVIVESLIGKIDASTLPETEKKNLRKEITDTLTVLESSSVDVMESIRLRFELAKLDSTPYSEAIKIAWPSKEAMGKLFSNLSGKTLEFFMLAVGFFQQLKTKISGAWENIKEGRMPTNTPQPQPNTPNQPERPPEVIDPISRSLNDATIITQEPEFQEGFITFSVPALGGSVLYRMKADGSEIKKKGETEYNIEVPSAESSSLPIHAYLTAKKGYIDNLVNKIMNPNNLANFDTKISTSLIQLQKKENGTNQRPPIDVAKIFSDKWDQISQNTEVLRAGIDSFRNKILDFNDANADEILRILKNPAQAPAPEVETPAVEIEPPTNEEQAS